MSLIHKKPGCCLLTDSSRWLQQSATPVCHLQQRQHRPRMTCSCALYSCLLIRSVHLSYWFYFVDMTSVSHQTVARPPNAHLPVAFSQLTFAPESKDYDTSESYLSKVTFESQLSHNSTSSVHESFLSHTVSCDWPVRSTWHCWEVKCGEVVGWKGFLC